MIMIEYQIEILKKLKKENIIFLLERSSIQVEYYVQRS